LSYTKNQKEAVLFNDGNLLVSASAGSGKTKVMVDRLIRLISEERANLQEILAVTFTELAAEEMKEKIREALIEKINDGKENLRSSLVEISNADISTMHSFCAKLIRRYFFEVGVSVDFEIIEKEEAEELKRRVIDQLFYELYEQKNANFLHLSECFNSKRKDKSFRETVLTIFDDASAEEDFDAFLDESVYNYTKRGFDYFKEKSQNYFKERLNEYKKEFIILKNELEENCLVERLTIVKNILVNIEEMLSLTLFDYCAFSNYKTETARKKIPEELKYLNEKFKSLKGSFQEFVVEKLSVYKSEEEEKKAFYGAQKTTESLVELVKTFRKTYAEEKKKLNKLDFNDLEHFALEILKNEKVKEDIQQKYKYIFIDEYQDTNGIQEAILNRLSNDNLFMVGDVKQSIYAFRGCNHKIFQEKMEKFNKKGEGLINLNHNFRSSTAVINFVNKVFTGKMTEEDFGINYEDASLISGGLYLDENKVEHFGEAELFILPYKAKEKEEKKVSVYNLLEEVKERSEEDEEVDLVVGLIREKLGQNFYDVKEKRERPIEYKDVVVLARSRNAFFQKLSKALIENGIPVCFDAKSKIADYPEINVLINLLRFIDCAKSDIPLAFTLKKVWKLTDDELYEIRKGCSDKKYFYQSCLAYKEKKNDLAKKLTEFYEYFEKIRFLADFIGAKKIIEKVIEDCGFEYTLLSSPFGKNKLKNVEAFLDEGVKNNLFLSVREFLEKIDNMEETSVFSASSENAVRIMTIHGSKGLEFPVVIVPNLNKTFNVQDVRDKVLFDREFGLGVKNYDKEDRSVSSTILTRFIKEDIILKNKKEELKLFYVALTRAKYCLYLTATLKKEQKYPISIGSSYYDFVYFLDGKESEKKVIERTGAKENEFVAMGKPNNDLKEKYKENLLFSYKEDYTLPLKTSVTKSLTMDRLEEEYKIPLVFAEEEVKEKGVLMHRFLEHCIFEESALKNLERMLKDGVFTKEESELLDLPALEKLLNSQLIKEIKEYKKYPEKWFIMEVPAKLLKDTTSNDNILVQGIIDLLCIKGDEVIILDYKYSQKDKDGLIKTYKKQLDLYALAVERSLNKKVIKKAIVSLRNSEVIEID